MQEREGSSVWTRTEDDQDYQSSAFSPSDFWGRMEEEQEEASTPVNEDGLAKDFTSMARQ